MGIQGALSTAVSGLTAQSYALENISGNIANSQTVGFKRVDTSFVDLIPESAARHESSGAVASFSQLTNTIQGAPKTTGITTNMALNGDGYFVVKEPTGTLSSPVFSGSDLYTRRGDFATDSNGYLVNGSGKYLVGTVPGAGAAPVKIPTTPIAASKTANVAYQGNLPTVPKTAYAATNPTTANSELLSPTLAGGATITGAQQAAFESQSIAGGEVTVYDPTGTAVTLQTRWAKTANADASATPAVQDTWQLYYMNNPAAGTTGTAYTKIGNSTFSSTGALTSASTFPITAMNVNGTAVGSVALNFGAGAVTQYAESSGQLSNGNVTQDGYPSGTLSNISVSNDGRVTGNYSNGQIKTIAQVQIAKFQANDALKRLDGSTYGATLESGSPSYGLQGSSLTSGSIEMSNTDISDEFSKMIITQQAYSANTKVMSTAQAMLQDIINVIR